MPKVSVIIPAYNALRFLPATIASVLAQTFQDFEVVVVDDGSADGTATWVRGHSDPRIHLVEQSNQGAAVARNAGIANATGEYIAFLDADDLWEPTKLAQQVACLDTRLEVGLVHTAIRYIDEHGDKVNRVLGVRGSGEVWREVVIYNPVRCGSTPLVRCDCFRTVGVFDPDLSFAEDWDMWIRISARYHFAVIDQPLVLYRQHETNMTKGYQAIMPNFIKVIEQAFRNAPVDSAFLKREAYGRAYLFAAWRAFFAGALEEATSFRKRALYHWPRLRYTRNSLSLGLKLNRAKWRTGGVT